MALFNYATKEITLKIVYYGPGLSGKTTNLQHLHSVLNPETKGRLLSLSTEADRTLFFDFLPVELGKIRDFSIRFQLYTVPGQVRYNATRKVVLKGADAVVFVADSQRDMREQNVESFDNMRENLLANNINPDEVPVVLQYNKRDLVNIASLADLNGDLNGSQYPVVEASAINGTGVEDSFRLVTRLLLKHISKKHQIEIQSPKEKEAVRPGPPVAAKTEHVTPSAPPAAAPVAPPAYAAEPIGKLQPKDKEEAASEPATPGPARAAEEAIPAEKTPAAASRAEMAQVLWPEEEEQEQQEQNRMPLELRPPEEPITLPPEKKEEVFLTAEAPQKPAESEERTALVVEQTAPPSPPEPSVFPVAESAPISGENMGRMLEELSNISSLLTDLKNSVYVLSKEMKDLKETRKEQEETNRILSDMLALFQQLRAKKGWFGF